MCVELLTSQCSRGPTRETSHVRARLRPQALALSADGLTVLLGSQRGDRITRVARRGWITHRSD